MQRLAAEVWRLDPAAGDETVGELAWMTRQHAGLEAEWVRRLWFDGADLVAWGWIKPPARLFWQVHPHRPELLDEVLTWYEGQATDAPHTLEVEAANGAAIAALDRRGFTHDATAPWFLVTGRGLDAIEAPQVPSGYRLTTMAETTDVSGSNSKSSQLLYCDSDYSRCGNIVREKC